MVNLTKSRLFKSVNHNDLVIFYVWVDFLEVDHLSKYQRILLGIPKIVYCIYNDTSRNGQPPSQQIQESTWALDPQNDLVDIYGKLTLW